MSFVLKRKDRHSLAAADRGKMWGSGLTRGATGEPGFLAANCSGCVPEFLGWQASIERCIGGTSQEQEGVYMAKPRTLAARLGSRALVYGETCTKASGMLLTWCSCVVTTLEADPARHAPVPLRLTFAASAPEASDPVLSFEDYPVAGSVNGGHRYGAASSPARPTWRTCAPVSTISSSRTSKPPSGIGGPS